MQHPDNVKRFIIGRQFFTVLTNFLLAQVTIYIITIVIVITRKFTLL